MTERILRRGEEGLERPEFVRGASFSPGANVTAEVVDRAVEATLKQAGVSSDVARVMRSLMAGDSQSPVARAYYHGVASSAASVSALGVSRRVYEVPYALSDEQVAALTAYAPDFSLRFVSKELHDHPMAAACRAVDRMIVNSRLPPVAGVSHVGGAIVPLVTSGQLGRGHHACMPIVDRKDPARHVLLKLRMRKISADYSASPEVRKAAQGFLDGDESHVCDRLVQECKFQTPVLTSVHVYDVPMHDWATVMDNKGGRLLEGCILFPRDILSRSSGEMTVCGARYEANATTDIFRMGFVDSPSWWYQHRLSDYLKYGVDQVLCSGGATYSYKVIERRGDTLFFRILRVSQGTLPDYRQVYRVPGVPMVRVNGFPLAKAGPDPMSWARRTYLFPAPLWQDMLGHAKESFERGVLTQERMFAYYRTVAPRQSINAVVVAGGSSVEDLNHLVPLVAHVVLFAMLEVRRNRAESTALLDATMQARAAEQEWTLYKVAAAVGESLKATFSLGFAPFLYLAKFIDDQAKALVEARSFDWEVQPTLQVVSAKLILPALYATSSDVVAGFEREYGGAAPADLVSSARANPRLASFALEALGDLLPQELSTPLEQVVERDQAAVRVAQADDQPKSGQVERAVASSVTGSASVSVPTVQTLELPEGEVQRRRLSIREAIDESRLEARKNEASCASHYVELQVGGTPNRKKLISRKEMFGNPEFWRVVGGIVESSFSGTPVAGFQHAAIYIPVPHAGSRLIQVLEEEFKGMSQGEYVERVHYRLADSDYTGWAYTNDSLMVYNGPMVERAMEAALSKPLDFVVVLNQGPPGCGKTTDIVNQVQPQDVVLVPARKSAAETRGRITDSKRMLSDVAFVRVRTLDSYLVNYDRTRTMRSMHADRLLADEAFMAREGRWLAAAALLGVSEISAFGDAEQIPHVSRVECPRLHVAVRPQAVYEKFVTYRCPPELVACWNSKYGWKVRSASSVKGSVSMHSSSSGLEIPNGCVMMGMYQADKKLLMEMYSSSAARIQIMTVHESQGNTYKDVWLHRFDTRPRVDQFSLYDKEEYVLVAMSRSTHSFKYISLDLGDVVRNWISKGKDLRRVMAAGDMDSLGESLEKL